MPYNLIWQIPGKHYWEYAWIRHLLSGLELVEHQDTTGDDFNHLGRYRLILPNAIIVDTGRLSLLNDKRRHRAMLEQRLGYFQEFCRQGYRVGLLHISDETGLDLPSGAYGIFAFVLRNYAYPQFDGLEHVRITPLGFSNLARANALIVRPRDINWSFMGTVWPTGPRATMLQAMQDVEGGFVHMTPHFARNIIPPARYRDTLSRTWLCPAPRGDRTWDTFRLYEGLEMGCLPIVERADGYYRRLLGDHALIEAKDWPDAARIARELLADRPKLEMRRRACEEWWHNFKINLAGDIAAFIRGRLTEPHSPGPLDQLESCHSD